MARHQASHGSSNRQTYTWSAGASLPMTIACRVRQTQNSEFNYNCPFGVHGTSSNDAWGFFADGTGAPADKNTWMVDWYDDSGADLAVDWGASVYTLNVWYSLVGRVKTGNIELDTRRMDTGATTNNNQSGTASTGLSLNTTAVCNAYYGGWAQGFVGDVAACAVWSVELTDAQVTEYMLGVSPLLIRPDALLFCDELIRGNGRDLITGVAGSVTGTITNVAHPIYTKLPSDLLLPGLPAAGGGAQSVTSASISSATTLYAPTVAPGAVTVTGASIGSTAALYPATIAQLAYEQEGYRWRDDDAGEAAASWLATQDNDISVLKGQNFRLRVLTDTGGGDPGAVTRTLQYRKVGDPDWSTIGI